MDYIFIVILVFIFLIFLILIQYFVFLFQRINHLKKETSLFLLDLDLKNWRIKKINSIWNNKNNKINNEKLDLYFNKEIDKGWVNISKIFDLLGPEETKKWKKSIQYCVQNKNLVSINSQVNIKSNKSYNLCNLKINFVYINPNKINIEIKSKMEYLDDSIFKNMISNKKEIIDNKNEFKLFIAFSLVDKTNQTFLTFINLIYNKLKMKDVKFLRFNELLIFVSTSNNYKKNKKLRKYINKKMTNYKTNSYINHLYDGLSYVECKDLENENDFSKIITRISFGLIKSRLNKKPFYFNLKNINFNEFENFKEKITSINNLIEDKDKNYDFLPVLEIKNEKEEFEYLKPIIDLKENYWNEYIMKMNDFENKIKDSFIENFLFSYSKTRKKIKKPILIEINDYQIERMSSLLSNKDYYFIIKQVQYTKTGDFIKLLNLIQLSNIQFALIIEEFDSKILTIIKNVKPNIIIVSKKFNDKFLNNQINDKLIIKNLINTSKNLDIKLIFQNIDSNIKNEILSFSNSNNNNNQYYLKM